MLYGPEISNPVWFILHSPFSLEGRWLKIKKSHPSISPDDPLELGVRSCSSDLGIFEAQVPFHKASEMSELPQLILLLLPAILSLARSSLHCLPLSSSLPDSYFCWWWWCGGNLSTLWKHCCSMLLCLVAPWVSLTSAYLQCVACVLLFL